MAEAEEKDTGKKLGKLVAAIWQDESLKKRFIEKPKQVLKEYGIDARSDKELVVLENTKDKTHIVLPEPPDGDILIDEYLSRVRGRLRYTEQELASQWSKTVLELGENIKAKMIARVTEKYRRRFLF
jgi:hypothetical protein